MFLLSHWNKILFFLACLALAIFSKNAVAGTGEMISARIHDDFESGEKSAWETYPFFQDMGFNPTLSCAHEPAHDGQFSLSQTFKPSDTDYPEDSNPVGLMKRTRGINKLAASSEVPRLYCTNALRCGSQKFWKISR